jgi:threonine/homoserine/homoserine lactone efflux protein
VRYVLLGLGLGLGAALSPGPLLALVVTTTLARGFLAGARIACAPLVTDAVIIAASLAVVHSLPARATGVLGVAGGLFVVYLGVESLRERPALLEAEPSTSGELGRGALVNLLSPHPWLFWITVGAPVLLSAWAEGPLPAIGFVVAFFLLLVGTKVVIAAVVAGGRARLSPTALHRAHRIAGLLLLITGVVLAVEFASALLHG